MRQRARTAPTGPRARARARVPPGRLPRRRRGRPRPGAPGSRAGRPSGIAAGARTAVSADQRGPAATEPGAPAERRHRRDEQRRYALGWRRAAARPIRCTRPAADTRRSDRSDPRGPRSPRVVADLPSRVVQAPDEIDVLSELEILVKACGRAPRAAPPSPRSGRTTPSCTGRTSDGSADPCRAPNGTARTRRSGPPVHATRRSAAQPAPPPGRPGGRPARRGTPADGMQSASRNATSGVVASSSPVLRAADAPHGSRRDARSARRTGRPPLRLRGRRAIRRRPRSRALARRRAAPDSAQAARGGTVDRDDDRHARRRR